MKKKIYADNKGIALITVVIGVMFCLLLTSTMLRVSLLGLQSREINNQASDTYYDAESVIDTVRMNLQYTATQAWATSTNGENSADFVKKTFELLTQGHKTYDSDASLNLSDTEKAYVLNVLRANIIQGGEIVGFSSITAVKKDGVLQGITIHDIEVKYTNPKNGMVSYLKTDMTINAPLYEGKKTYPLATYSLFVGSGATLWNAQSSSAENSLDPLGGAQGSDGAFHQNQLGFFEQHGNVYIGWTTRYNDKSADALKLYGGETMSFTGESVVINGNVLLKGNSTVCFLGDYAQVNGKIFIGPKCHLVLGENTNLKCQDIVFFNSNADVKGAATNDGYASDKGLSVVDNEIASQNYGKTYAGQPKDYYSMNLGGGNGADAKYPYYCNNASIVYAYKDTDGVIKYRDAKIVGTDIQDKDGSSLLTVDDHGFYLSKDDANLQPVNRTNGYDYMFAKMIDVAYFKYAFIDHKDNTQNGKIVSGLKDNKFIKDTDGVSNKVYGYTEDANTLDTIKNEVTSSGNYYWVDDTGKFRFAVKTLGERKTSGGTDGNGGSENNPPYLMVDFNNISDLKFYIVFRSTNNDLIIHSKLNLFVLYNTTITYHVDAASSECCGLFYSPAGASLKKDTGVCTAYSLYDYLMKDINAGGEFTVSKYIDMGKVSTFGNDPDKMAEALAPLTNFFDSIGYCLSTTNTTDSLEHFVFNNYFNGGIKRFYDFSGASGGNSSGFKVNVTHNSKMDLIDYSDYEKK